MTYWNCPQCDSINFIYRSKCYNCKCFRSKAILRVYQKNNSESIYSIIFGLLCLIVLFIVYNWFSIILIMTTISLGIMTVYNYFSYIQSKVYYIQSNVNGIKNKIMLWWNKSQDIEPLDQDNKTCIICFDKEINTLISNCGHLGCCFECASNMNTCPICRVPYNLENLIRIYKVN